MNLKEFKTSGNANRPHFLLVGNPVGHSLSPLMHNTAARHYHFTARYYAIQLEASELGSFAAWLNEENLRGVNITIPYKERMLEYVDELRGAGRDIGAINTISKKNGQLAGHNTDVFGFRAPLRPFQDEFYGARAIVFGTGGASKAIMYALQKLDFAEIVVVSRNPERHKLSLSGMHLQVCSYNAWPAFAEGASLVVNATPLGMIPREEHSPVKESEKEYLEGTVCYDVVYRPLQTRFLQLAKQAGARTIGGLEMLIYQGSRSFELWTGKPFPVEIIRDTLNDYLNNDD